MLKPSQINKIQKKINAGDTSLSSLFGILGDKNRFRILKILIEYGELCVSDLAAILNISISAVSQHLRILEMSGLVASKRMGQMMCYKPLTQNSKIKAIIKLM